MNKTSEHVYDAELGPESNLENFFESSMLVTQTGFFRLDSLYQDLEKEVLPALYHHRQNNISELRIWSAGCSDGREPYSIGMTILGWLKTRAVSGDFLIDASDINKNKIRIARKGEYQVSDKELKKLRSFAEYHHRSDYNKITIGKDLRQRIRFKVENLINRKIKKEYDIIVCTNVLLYYNQRYRKTIVYGLSAFLKKNGFLYVETVGNKFLKANGFIRLKAGSHFFRKVSELKNHIKEMEEN